MKKRLLLCAIFLTIICSMVVCEAMNTPEPTAEPTLEPGVVDRYHYTDSEMRDYNKMVSDAIIEMATRDFYDPSSVRLLEIRDFERGSIGDETIEEIEAAPWTITVRLQGNNRVGGSVNHYYVVCIKSGTTIAAVMQDLLISTKEAVQTFEKYGRDASIYRKRLLSLSAVVGEYVDIGDSFTLISSFEHELFSIKEINQAIKAHWEELGL